MARGESTTQKSHSLNDSCFNIVSQIEKKADFLHTVVEQYIRDAEKENKPHLLNLWNSIKQDEQKHMMALKEELSREIREGPF
jgi:hypothetical protein